MTEAPKAELMAVCSDETQAVWMVLQKAVKSDLQLAAWTAAQMAVRMELTRAGTLAGGTVCALVAQLVALSALCWADHLVDATAFLLAVSLAPPLVQTLVELSVAAKAV